MSDNDLISVPPFVVLQDGCEKDSLNDLFPEGVIIRQADLRPTGGDYSAEGLETTVAVERKSIQDLLNTLYGKTRLADGSLQDNLGRFAWELQKLAGIHLAYVAVEGTQDDLRKRIDRREILCRKLGKKQRISFSKALGLISSLQSEFGVVFKFFRDRAEMAAAIYADLYHSWRRKHGLSKSKIGTYQPPKRKPKGDGGDERQPNVDT